MVLNCKFTRRAAHDWMSETKNAIWHWILDAAIGFAIALLTLAIIGVISYRETRNLISQQAAVNHCYQVLRDIKSLEAAVSEEDRTELAFLTSGDFKESQWHRDLNNTLQQTLRNIEESTAGNASQQKRVALMRTALADKERSWQQLAPEASTSSAAIQHSAAFSESKKSSETLRSLLAEMTADQEQTLKAERERYEASASRAGHTVVVMVLFTFIFLGTAYRSIRKDIRSRRQTESALQDLKQQLQEALEKEKELARLDSLTGLANRRAFYEVLELEQKRARRYELPLTVAYLDVDNFKKINDTSGHSLGDSVLIVVAHTIKNNIRASDTVARLGGDEFAVLLPETEAAAAETVLRKLQGMLQTKTQENGWTISFSIGVATFLFPPESLDDIIRTADEVMYAVKTSGKNNLSVAILG
jgi:diguanylate cyclase (GGDEF)-like protein